MVLWEDLGDLPAYAEHLDGPRAPAPVRALRESIAHADALLIATPEYNGSLPGALKNALDWASRPYPDNVLKAKPAAVVGASTGLFGAVWAQAEARKVLEISGADVVEEELPVGRADTVFDEHGDLMDPQLCSRLAKLLDGLLDRVTARHAGADDTGAHTELQRDLTRRHQGRRPQRRRAPARSAGMPLVIAVIVVLIGAAPAQATWTSPDAATRAGRSVDPSVALDRAGHLVVGWTRRLRGVNRVELRQGTGRQGLRGESTIVFGDAEHAAHLADLAFTGEPGSPVAVLFQRYAGRSHRAALGIVPVGGRVPTSVQTLSGGGESAYAPRFAGEGPTAFWSRRTFAQAADVHAGGAGAIRSLPPGVGAMPTVARQPDSTLLVAWVDGGDLRLVRVRPDGTIGPVTGVEDDGGYARDPRLAVRRDGTAHLVWLATAGDGNAVRAAVVDAAGTAGRSVKVAGAEQGARDPEVAVSATGEGIVAWLSTGSGSGSGAAAGIVRLQRLTATGAPVGPGRRLSPNGVRTLDVRLTAGDPGSAFAAWAHLGRGADPVHVRRIAPAGILGHLTRLARDTDSVLAPALATSGTGAVVGAWENEGRIWVSRLR